jgi:hypothetical protein
MRALRTGEEPRLSMTSETRLGESVQIDDWDATRGVPRELKSSLDLKNVDAQTAEHLIESRMGKHAEYASGHNLPYYEWVAHSQDMYQKMVNSLAKLPAGLRDKIRITPDFYFE